MASLLVYGSLLNKNELLKKNINLSNCIPVIVKNFKRGFTQEPSWRKTAGNNRAVLRVDISNDHFINALLIQNISQESLKDIDKREIGYNRVIVDKKDIKLCYGSLKEKKEDDIYIYIGKKEKYNSDIFPNPDYLNLCLEGAAQWGEKFHKDFLDSTIY